MKKIFRWLSMLSPVLFALPMFLDTWAIKTTVGETTTVGEGFGIFEDLEPLEKLFIGNNKFVSIWLTLFTVMAVAALVISVACLVVYLLDELKVTKLQKLEKVLSIILLTFTILGIIFGFSAIFANNKLNIILGSASLAGLGGLWAFVIGGVVFSVFTIVGVGKSTGKKRK